MKNIKSDIVNKTFKKVYLLYGEEEYLIRLYRDSLKKAALGDDGSDMNYNHYTGQDLNLPELEDIAVTLPFFADRRVILLEDSGLFGSDQGFGDFLTNLPETTVIIMTEGSVDKRSKLFKAVKDNGYVCEFAPLKPEEMLQFVAGQLAKSGKKLSRETCDYFVNAVGGDMYNVVTELEKLICYTGDRDIVTIEDINAVCTMQLENRIFDLVDQLNRHNIDAALRSFSDLMALKETPLGILRFISKQYMKLSALQELIEDRESDTQIAARLHMQDWLVRKNRSRLRGVDSEHLKKAVSMCTGTEEDIKCGRLGEQTGVEILLANLAAL